MSQSRRIPAITSSDDADNVIACISLLPIVIRSYEAAIEAGTVAKKLICSTNKAAWIADTSFLILAVPLIIEMDREQQVANLEMQQASLLSTPRRVIGVGGFSA